MLNGDGILLSKIYDALFQYFGPRHWWPAETAEEVVIGAILVQGVAWSNVEKAISRLKHAGLLSLNAIHRADESVLAECVRSTLYYRMKVKKLKAFAGHIAQHYEGKLESLFDKPMGEARKELLQIYGIGPETADSILLYAGGLPTFVVDAYTRRIFSRMGYVEEKIPYEDLRRFFMERLPQSTELFNEYHALLVELGKQICTARKPKCGICPLGEWCKGKDKI
ncbi:endonuclease III [Collibacillus ludicampi]|uniref:Endonuclease III n=1 Tax=Collibacillus ludicampi TaxID=2771369 RepID=A0AAV4LEJ2_9BACL|nr:endonuclease [Collibacillus ludicampi]GIM46252.1 endonuclease III [Collibacillus ludicampi]